MDRRGYLTVVLEVEKGDNMVVMRPENVRDWYNRLQRMVVEMKAKELQSTEEFWSKKVVKFSKNADAQHHFPHNKPCSTTSLDRRRRRDRNDFK